MRILMVGSDRLEFRGILSHCESTAPSTAQVDWASTARLNSNQVTLVANGAGVTRAAAAVEAALAVSRPDALVSLGFGGALRPDLAVADIVVATEVCSSTRRYAALPLRSPKPHRRGIVRTHSHVAQTLADRRSLAARGAAVVDMEASAVADCARIHSLPFYCVKVVTDLAAEAMVNDFNKALREDGHFDTIILLKGVLRQPFARMPELLRLRSRSVRAARALGDFFADCRY